MRAGDTRSLTWRNTSDDTLKAWLTGADNLSTFVVLLPAVLRDWRGFFLEEQVSAPQLSVVIDYQNIHLTARDRFAPLGVDARATIVHPLLFAEEATQGWVRQHGPAELARVLVFRGCPSNARDPELYSAAQRQRSEWTRDRRVQVTYRTLRYSNKPKVPAREKGIDVLVALHLVKLASDPLVDIVLLAAHDTDQEPALAMAVEEGSATVGTVGWDRSKRLRVPRHSVPHVSLDAPIFVRTRDRKQYFSEPTPNI